MTFFWLWVLLGFQNPEFSYVKGLIDMQGAILDRTLNRINIELEKQNKVLDKLLAEVDRQ